MQGWFNPVSRILGTEGQDKPGFSIFILGYEYRDLDLCPGKSSLYKQMF